jgi:hypothetical protein
VNAIRKAIVATIGAVLTWGLTAHMPDGSIDRGEWWGLAVAVATALGVWAVPNGPAQVQVVNDPGDPVPVEEKPERGAVEPGSLALGVLIGVVLVLLLTR